MPVGASGARAYRCDGLERSMPFGNDRRNFDAGLAVDLAMDLAVDLDVEMAIVSDAGLAVDLAAMCCANG